MTVLLGFTLVALVLVATVAGQDVVWRDPSPHGSQFVKVDDSVELEVLDWQGSGRPIVLLAGLGNSGSVMGVIPAWRACIAHPAVSRARAIVSAPFRRRCALRRVPRSTRRCTAGGGALLPRR